MALDPRISLQGRVVDVGAAIGSGLQNAQRIAGLGENRAIAQQNALLRPLEVQRQEQAVAQGVQTQGDAQLQNFARAALLGIQSHQAGDVAGVERSFQMAFPDPARRQSEFAEYQQNPEVYMQQAASALAQINKKSQSAKQQEFAALVKSGNLSPRQIEQAARIDLGIDPRAVGSAAQTISATGAAQDVGASEAVIAGQVAKAKAEERAVGKAVGEEKVKHSVAKTKSFINSQVKLAEKAATERGEVLTDLARSQAALPGLRETVGKLKELAPIATSTLGGRITDAAIKELGFGSTKGATAKAKFIAIIDNQILPLLKPTFGAAFTVQEGESLKATLGDPNASPEEKIAQLNAFIDQKERDIKTKQLQLDQTAAGGSVAAQGQEVTTQAQFDALPSGAVYTEDGIQYRKP